MIVEFPPELDIAYCRALYPELKNFPDETLAKDFKNFAEQNGLSTCYFDRKEYLKATLQKAVDEQPIDFLEIGPLNNPFVKSARVKYFDVWNAEDLRRRTKNFGLNSDSVPEVIHYVEPHGDLSIVPEKFDIVFSSHCIEHQPDLVRHLQNVNRLLKDGGVYILFIPDKRYCFDYYRQETTLFGVIEAFVKVHSLHTFRNLAEAYCSTTHNDAGRHWQGDHGAVELKKKNFVQAISDYEKSLSGGGYVDCHAWCFTPKVFGEIINGLNKLDLVTLSVHRLCHTLRGRQEFCAVLKKND